MKITVKPVDTRLGAFKNKTVTTPIKPISPIKPIKPIKPTKTKSGCVETDTPAHSYNKLFI